MDSGSLRSVMQGNWGTKSNLLNVTSEIWDNGLELTTDLVKQAFVHISFL